MLVVVAMQRRNRCTVLCWDADGLTVAHGRRKTASSVSRRASVSGRGERATLLSPSGTIAENLSVLAWNDRRSVLPAVGRRWRRPAVVSPTGDRLYPFTHLQTQFVVAVSLSRLRRQNCFVPPMSGRVTRDDRPANEPAGCTVHTEWRRRTTWRQHNELTSTKCSVAMFTFQRHFLPVNL